MAEPARDVLHVRALGYSTVTNAMILVNIVKLAIRQVLVPNVMEQESLVLTAKGQENVGFAMVEVIATNVMVLEN